MWGSCGRDGTINLNWCLIFAPEDGAGVCGGLLTKL